MPDKIKTIPEALTFDDVLLKTGRVFRFAI
jgi:IMP dehydrogenase/GMP reductase